MKCSCFFIRFMLLVTFSLAFTVNAQDANVTYFEIQEILHDELPWLYLTRLDNLIAYDDGLVIPEVGSLPSSNPSRSGHGAARRQFGFIGWG